MITTNPAEEMVDEERRREFVEVARDFAQREIAPHAAVWDPATTYPADVLKHLGFQRFDEMAQEQIEIRLEQQTRLGVIPDIFLVLDTYRGGTPRPNNNGRTILLPTRSQTEEPAAVVIGFGHIQITTTVEENDESHIQNIEK